MASPTVSVIVPAFNAASFLPRALRSVAQQTMRDFEVIVVDDASSDDTVEVARKYGEELGVCLRVLALDTNSGPAVARNAGVATAKGEFVSFLDADDVWMPGKLSRQVEIMRDDNRVTLCGCNAYWVDTNGAQVALLFEGLAPRQPNGWKILLWHSYVATPCAMARREDLGIAPFNPRLKIAEDRDLWIRLATNGVVGLVPDPLVNIELRSTSYMARNANLIATVTADMLRGHMRSNADALSVLDHIRAERVLARQIGKQLCSADRYWRGTGYLIKSTLMGGDPFDNFRHMLLTAPIIRDMKKYFRSKNSAGVRGG
ncbi:MAG: glycosyltransferase family 2 protein [Rhodobacteraceae bacterium]|nr:glycosyltransferase family 2 protein [Paracoccaceae bacterium]